MTQGLSVGAVHALDPAPSRGHDRDDATARFGDRTEWAGRMRKCRGTKGDTEYAVLRVAEQGIGFEVTVRGLPPLAEA